MKLARCALLAIAFAALPASSASAGTFNFTCLGVSQPITLDGSVSKNTAAGETLTVSDLSITAEKPEGFEGRNLVVHYSVEGATPATFNKSEGTPSGASTNFGSQDLTVTATSGLVRIGMSSFESDVYSNGTFFQHVVCTATDGNAVFATSSVSGSSETTANGSSTSVNDGSSTTDGTTTTTKKSESDKKSGGSSPLVPILIIAALVLAAVVGGILWFKRARGKGSPPPIPG